MNNRPLVSIVTPTLNSEMFIRDNIQSVVSQTYSSIEHIIVDGGSTDNTVAIARAMEPKAVIISEPDDGISDAFNKGIKLATGDIIAILNSDDYYAGSKVIERVVEIFTSKHEVKVIYGKVRCIHPETGETLALYYNESFSIEKMKKKLIIPHPATFMRREVYETVGEFSLQYRICMDHEYLLKAIKIYQPYALDEVLTVMRWGGLSTKNIYLAHREVYRIIRSNGGNIVSALLNLAWGYTITYMSLSLQKIGLTKLVLFYRKQVGRL